MANAQLYREPWARGKRTRCKKNRRTETKQGQGTARKHGISAISESLQVGVSLHHFFCAVIGEAYRQLPLFVFTLDANDRARPVGAMTHAHPDQWMRIRAP